MRRMTITKVIDKNGVTFEARKPTKPFQAGELVKFIFPDNEVISIVRTDCIEDSVCEVCVWGGRCKSPMVGNHRLCAFIPNFNGRFERLDNVLESL